MIKKNTIKKEPNKKLLCPSRQYLKEANKL